MLGESRKPPSEAYFSTGAYTSGNGESKENMRKIAYMHCLQRYVGNTIPGSTITSITWCNDHISAVV